MKKAKIVKGIKMVQLENGSIRSDDSNKPRCGLLPVHALLRISELFTKGAAIHGDRNWELGQYQSRYIDSLFRHLLKYIGGATDEDHLSALIWNAMALVHQEELIKRGLMDKKYQNHRVLLDKRGKQCIPMSVFLPDEFSNIKSTKKTKKKTSKKKRK